MEEAERSVLRVAGPSRQALPMDLNTIASLDPNKFTSDVAKLAASRRMYLSASLFLLRELELATLRVRHVDLDTVAKTVSLYLAVSKTDPEARGCFRKWGVPMCR